MELFKLLTPSYLPGDTVANWDSLVWTERYQSFGDFEINVENDITILTKLPIGTLISHTDTYSVMIVEDHNIKRDKDQKLQIKVTGRTFETFAENRPTVGCDSGLYNSGTGAAIVETITNTPENVAKQLFINKMVSPTASASDAISNLNVRTSIRVPDTSASHVIRRGDTYSRAMEILNICDAGIKVVRPNGAQTTLDIVIHDGADNSTSVIFYAQLQDLENAEYLWSNKKYRNYAQISAHTAVRTYRHRDLGSDLTGLNRRVQYVDANDLEGAFSPPLSTDAMATRAQNVLDAHKMVTLVQAKIATTAKPRFKVNYDVGDLVGVFGEFSVAQTMRITEHILTVDTDGIRGYPALSAV